MDKNIIISANLSNKFTLKFNGELLKIDNNLDYDDREYVELDNSAIKELYIFIGDYCFSKEKSCN